ncbi:MAG: hypothetical protein H6631_09870 [Anaerolineaceae bacterium]|nr:hypothetical protein [Anaerolineaceae bacterium]
MPLTQFSAPGHLADFSPAQGRAWSALLQSWIDLSIEFLKDQYGEPVYFFNEIVAANPALDTAPVEDIFWDGFPRSLRLRFDQPRALQEADQVQSLAAYYTERDRLLIEYPAGAPPRLIDFHYRNQDEYLEWFVSHNPQTGAMEAITFTCEAPEYWRFIGNGSGDFFMPNTLPPDRIGPDPAKLLQLYQTLVSPQVRLEDLLFRHPVIVFDRSAANKQEAILEFWPAGSYNPYNKWNTSHGLAHLTHPANTLKAQVQLAAKATILRQDLDGSLIKNDAIKLICCSGNGQPNRASDPTIGERINNIVRQGIAVTVPDPVGLYIYQLDTNGLEGPNGEWVDDCWQIIRGREGMILRAEFRVPPGRPYRLEDIRVDAEPLRHGGQLAAKIKMFLQGKGFDFGQPPPRPHFCSYRCCADQGNFDLKKVTAIASELT